MCVCVFVFVMTFRMLLQWNTKIPSEAIIRHWFCVATILLLTCSSSFQLGEKCQTCRDLVKRFKEVAMLHFQMFKLYVLVNFYVVKII